MKVLSLFLLFLSICQSAFADRHCKITVMQREKEVIPRFVSITNVAASGFTGEQAKSARFARTDPIRGLAYQLKAEPFELEVSPSACRPSIAAIPNYAQMQGIFARPLIFTSGFGMAGGEDIADILIHWARSEFDPALYELPSEGSFLRTQYDQLCQELKQCPNIYPTFSTFWPFKRNDTGSKAIAKFRRANEGQALDILAGKSLLTVLYTEWVALPSEYKFGNPTHQVVQPHLLRFSFDKVATTD